VACIIATRLLWPFRKASADNLLGHPRRKPRYIPLRHLALEPTGVGKSWIGCALAQKACRDGFSVLHKKTSELFLELAIATSTSTVAWVGFWSGWRRSMCFCSMTSPWRR
jgi:hypothetical protein